MIPSAKLYQGVDYIMPLYLFISLPGFYLGMWNLSVIAKYYAFLLILFLLKEAIGKGYKNKGIGMIFTIYLLYCLLSIIWYGINGVNLRCFIRELYNTIPAMFFVYIGMTDNRTKNTFHKWFLNSCSLSMLLGIFLYLSMPGWFLTRKTEYTNYIESTANSENLVLAQMRFSSYLGDTYEVDVYAMLALCISLFTLFYAYKNKRNTLIPYFCLFINFVAAILCQQRVAMVYAVLAIFIFILYGLRSSNQKASIKLLTVFVISISVLFFAVFYYFGDRAGQLFELLADRVDKISYSETVGGRDYQMKLLTEHWDMPIFGHGLGSGGSVAGALGYPHVTDCSYIELLYETGVVGFILFLIIIILTIRRGVKYAKYYLTELTFIGFILIAMVGSNTLTISFMSIYPFWYSIGLIWNKTLLYNLKKNQINI